MKLPKIFMPEKDLEAKTRELLKPKLKKKGVVFSDYVQIRYSTECTSWALEYDRGNKEWMLDNKEHGGQRWFKSDKLDELAENILKNRITPLVELLNLKEKDYSIVKDNFRSILDRYATKIAESKDSIKDKGHGECMVILYEKGNMTIKLREYDKIHLGRMDVLDGC